MESDMVRAIMATIGLAEDGGSAPVFERHDGSRGRVDRQAELDQEGPIPSGGPLVAQVSRWDRLKDPIGVLQCFAENSSHPRPICCSRAPRSPRLPTIRREREVLAEVRDRRAGLPPRSRDRIHLACLPMDDVEENAAMVNAIQRSADVVLQKSLAEGFGLTVAEAMWKSRPVVAGRIGGIQDQIVDGVSGCLVDDPRTWPRSAGRSTHCSATPSAQGRSGRPRTNEFASPSWAPAPGSVHAADREDAP